MDRESKLRIIANHYGYDHQLNKLVEEIGEVLVEISKYKAAENIADAFAAIVALEKELADVEVLIMQLKILGDKEHIEETIDYKIQRQLGRMQAKRAFAVAPETRASGEALDSIAHMFGVERDGMGDDELRAKIEEKIHKGTC